MLSMENVELWEGLMPASMIRVLVTKWVGAAYERLCRDYKESIAKCFTKCGQLMTIDESGDDKIAPIAGIPYDFKSIWEAHKRSQIDSVLSGIVSSILREAPNAVEEPVAIIRDCAAEIDCDSANIRDEEDEDEDECAEEDNGEIGLISEENQIAGEDNREIGLVSEENQIAGDGNVSIELETETWDQCVILARHIYGEVSIAEEIDTQRIPKRLTGLVVIWFSTDEENEWDLCKVDLALSSPGLYRLQSLSTGQWYYDIKLSASEAYGRASRSFVFISSVGSSSSVFLRA
jgi:hypothetical protein